MIDSGPDHHGGIQVGGQWLGEWSKAVVELAEEVYVMAAWSSHGTEEEGTGGASAFRSWLETKLMRSSEDVLVVEQ